MKPLRFMVVAGETSGDILAAELVGAICSQIAARPLDYTPDQQPLRASLAPSFFGAGGPRMAEAGVQLVVDMSRHSAIGISDVFRKLLDYARIFYQLKGAALKRQPDVIVCVDFSGFNRRWAHAIRGAVRRQSGIFNNWRPRLVQYVSPQVWASREGRIYSMERDLDLLLALFPFEKGWYARRVPNLRVEFVGHPMLDRYPVRGTGRSQDRSELLLLPGSRPGELARHLPALFPALQVLRTRDPKLRARMVVPSESLLAQAREMRHPEGMEMQVGGLPSALQRAKVAIASTGTVTMECALFGVPTVTLYKTSWSTYQVGKRVVKVRYLAMPNILADAEIYPEFVQDAATAENISRAALSLWQDSARRQVTEQKLAEVIASLGEPGAAQRAAGHILSLL